MMSSGQDADHWRQWGFHWCTCPETTTSHPTLNLLTWTQTCTNLLAPTLCITKPPQHLPTTQPTQYSWSSTPHNTPEPPPLEPPGKTNTTPFQCHHHPMKKTGHQLSPTKYWITIYLHGATTYSNLNHQIPSISVSKMLAAGQPLLNTKKVTTSITSSTLPRFDVFLTKENNIAWHKLLGQNCLSECTHGWWDLSMSQWCTI